MREEPGSCKTPVPPLILKAVAYLTPTLLAFLVFLPTLGYDFVSWDDAQYVYENPAIRSLEPSSLWHIFKTTDLTKWHPLTIVSFAVDYAVWGLDPRGFHLTNTLLHALNTLLVVVIVGRLCTLSGLKSRGVLATAFITALIFSVHPLRVESVAWVTERKDVLYGAFYLLSILAYTSYAAPATKDRWRAKAAYLLSLTLFGLASMSKPMAVTLPVILLILDFYPLKRLGDSAVIYVEKVPFFLISLFTGVMILRANLSLDTAPGFAELPLYERVLNAAHSCVFYLYKTFVPTGLAPFYPPAEDVLTPAYFASAAAIIMISALCVWLWIFAKKGSRLYLTLWLYYLVTLVPVLGFVQVGSQAAADRFTYMASLGPALLAALGGYRIARKVPIKGRAKANGRSSSLGPCGLWRTLLPYGQSGRHLEEYHNALDSPDRALSRQRGVVASGVPQPCKRLDGGRQVQRGAPGFRYGRKGRPGRPRGIQRPRQGQGRTRSGPLGRR